MKTEFEEGKPEAFCAADLIEWIKLSQKRESWPEISVPLTLPPLQRNSVWRPQQVLNLWRSTLDGLPIGLFYVHGVEAGSEVVDPDRRTELIKLGRTGWSLIDGQQRARALVLGAGDPFGDGRCVWVRFKEGSYELLLSSRMQPAGYQSDGSRHPVSQRQDWLKANGDRVGAGRGVLADATRWWQSAPLPIACKPEDTAKLADLLQWAAAPSANETLLARIAACRRWQSDVARLQSPGCAVFMRLPETIVKSTGRMLDLFRRVGAGGTPLTQADQLYAAYKIHKPELRRVVENIHGTISAILTPGQIIETAIRIAHTMEHPDTGWMPGFDQAIAAFSEPNDDKKPAWAKRVDTLLTPSDGSALLERSFAAICKMLDRCETEDGGNFYLPRIAMAQLPIQLWQVLVFWWSRSQPADTPSRREIVRFALFWRLAVTKAEKAVQRCFKNIAKDVRADSFDGHALYKLLLTGEKCAHALAAPAQLTDFFSCPCGDEWIKHEQRFPKEKDHKEIAETWWFAASMLPWLQRRYVDTMFATQDPLSDHEDDLPYDVDHICARSLWQAAGRYDRNDFSNKEEWEAATGQAWSLGEAIGNKRLVKFQQNRSDGANSLCVKMPFLCGPLSSEQLTDFGAAEDFCIDRDSFADWVGSDPAEPQSQKWPQERRTRFRRVIEKRTASLYQLFYNELEFAEWCED